MFTPLGAEELIIKANKQASKRVCVCVSVVHKHISVLSMIGYNFLPGELKISVIFIQSCKIKLGRPAGFDLKL